VRFGDGGGVHWRSGYLWCDSWPDFAIPEGYAKFGRRHLFARLEHCAKPPIVKGRIPTKKSRNLRDNGIVAFKNVKKTANLACCAGGNNSPNRKIPEESRPFSGHTMSHPARKSSKIRRGKFVSDVTSRPAET
jgi:hypothetical protein